MGAAISFISEYLPEGTLTNEMLNKDHPEWSADQISSKTGIYTRHISAPDEFSSDMAVKAAEKLFLELPGVRQKIDYLLFCTQSPDYFLPTTACLIQNRLGISNHSGALHFNLGCSGFIYGLGLAKGLINTGQAKHVLLLTAETYSKFINSLDKNNKTIFGDGAAATLISADKLNGSLNGVIKNLAYRTDGSGAENLIVKKGGMRFRDPVSRDEFDENHNFVKNEGNLYMDGKEIFKYTASSIPELIQATLDANQISLDQVDLFIFHQANEFMLQAVRKKCNIPEEKFFIHLKDCANTVSSTVPIALNAAINQKRVTPGMKVLMSGFGVGYSSGAVLIEY